ncbi:MAG: MtsA protein, partial [Myxococcaceae bacterium]
LSPGMTLWLGPPLSRELPLTVLDPSHAYARLPAGLTLPPGEVQATVALTLGKQPPEPGAPTLTLVNDSSFPDLTALAISEDGAWLFAASTPTDQVFAVEVSTGKVQTLGVGDGPVALAPWRDSAGAAWMVVAHAFAPELHLLPVGRGGGQRVLPGPSSATGLAIDPAAGVAFVAEHARDTVYALKLSEGGRELWRAPVAPNPRELALAGGVLAVGSVQTGEVELLDAASGAPLSRVSPGPGTPIVGGGTEAFSSYVMGGTAVRALCFSPKLSRLFLSSVGPNIGPNPRRMEVSMNGGVAVLDPAPPGRTLRHLGFGAGVTEGLALDDDALLLYAADPALGLVRVLDARALAAGDDSARGALLQELAVPPPPGFPTARPLEDYATLNRAGASLHSGPRALSLAPGGRTLFALDRFTGTVAVFDVGGAARGEALLTRQLPVVDTLGQRTRRLGQVLYYADLGRTAMSCDACHPEGHSGGVLFEKTQPLRLYRSTSILGSRESPPYFTPASTRSLGETASFVGARNRFHNPDPTPAEIDALASYVAALTAPPNPFVGEDGAPKPTLELPDGRVGRPRAGLTLFEGRAGCAGCHPAPQFTTDQDVGTRGRYQDVGTPRALALRPELQDQTFQGFAPPSLLNGWDVFPMLSSGAAGLEVRDGALAPTDRFPLRVVVERYGGPQHGRAGELSAAERDDLLAYLMSL